jgi:hypothetical protein
MAVENEMSNSILNSVKLLVTHAATKKKSALFKCRLKSTAV